MRSGPTIQDIANALQLSRNTVSKALNGKYVPPKTRNAVLNAAIEMGYKSYGTVATADMSFAHKKVMVLSSRLLLNINYYVHVMRGIESALTDYDIELIQFTLSPNSSFDRLRSYLENYRVDGIICIELFDAEKVRQLLETDYPVVFLDMPMPDREYSGNYDLILPENFDAIRNFCMRATEKTGVRTYGFVGDYTHCRSFYERFLGMKEAMFLSGLDTDLSYSVSEKDTFPYANVKELCKRISLLPALPDCFIAANDTIAIALADALKMLGKRVPEDVKVTGFDNINESKLHNPPITTFNVDKVGLGKKLITILLERMNDPLQRSRTIYIKSKLVIRSST